MKKTLLLLALPLIMTACTQRAPQNDGAEETQAAQEQVINTENVKTLVLNVEGMTCTGCEESIQKSVNALPGIVEVTASHTDSLTTVAFDPGLASVEQIQEAITKVGYIVTGFHFEEEQAGPDTLTPQE